MEEVFAFWEWSAHSLNLSAQTVGLSALLFVLLGIPLAWWLSLLHSRFKWVVESVVTLPLIFPPIATGFLLLWLLGRHGFLGSFFAEIDIAFVFTLPGLVIAGFVAGLPLMVKPIQSTLESFPKNLLEAGRVSGRSERVIFVRVVLPVISRTLVAALLIASARALGEVGITLMLGGNIIGKTDTVSLAIYNAVFDGEMEKAMQLSLLLVFFSLLLFAFLQWLQKEKTI